MAFMIKPTDKAIASDLSRAIDNKTKPQGSLGVLEQTALKIGLIQQSFTPRLIKPTIVVFAGDHGIASEPISAYPKEVTYQMVLNFLHGGAAINVFAKQNGIKLTIVNAGVDHEFVAAPGLIDIPVAKGTANFLHGSAMTTKQCQDAIEQGASVVRELHKDGTNVIGFGEMGIGNTSSAAMIMHSLCELPLKQCVGRGTGLTDEQLQRKLDILERALAFNGVTSNPVKVLSTYGGFEIAMMVGAFLQAAELSMIILIDGFIATAALLVAHKLQPAILDYCIFSHVSDENGHASMVQYLQGEPLLRLKLRLGEATGTALAYPLVISSVEFINNMASFDSAHVSEKQD